MTITELITARLSALDFDALAELYRPDALLDVSVPQWRYQLQGPEAIRLALAEGLGPLAGNTRVTGQRATRTDDGVVVELEVRFVQDGEERLWREVHVFHTDGTAITEHLNYCTGVWDAATIARQAVEAPMVRR